MAEDSQLPALIGETLPAVLSDDLPDKPADFDGWTTETIGEWISRTGSDLVRYDVKMESARLAVGLALHILRDRIGEGNYGREALRLAGEIGVHEGTLRRWRSQAENHLGLKPPKAAAKRAKATKKAAKMASAAKLRAIARSSRENAIDTTAKEITKNGDVGTGKTVVDQVRDLLPVSPAALSQAAKRSELVKLEGLAKQAQQAESDDGSRLALLAPDVVSRLAVCPTEPFDAGVNRAIRDLLAEVERSRQSAPAPPPPTPPAATKVKVAAAKKAPKPAAVKRPKKGEPCPHPVEAHDGLDMSGVTCTWCGESALTIVSLLRMGERAMAAAK